MKLLSGKRNSKIEQVCDYDCKKIKKNLMRNCTSGCNGVHSLPISSSQPTELPSCLQGAMKRFQTWNFGLLLVRLVQNVGFPVPLTWDTVFHHFLDIFFEFSEYAAPTCHWYGTGCLGAIRHQAWHYLENPCRDPSTKMPISDAGTIIFLKSTNMTRIPTSRNVNDAHLRRGCWGYGPS